jgi:hypothetical protein
MRGRSHRTQPGCQRYRRSACPDTDRVQRRYKPDCFTPRHAHRCINEVRPNGRGTRLTLWVCRDRRPPITACGAHSTNDLGSSVRFVSWPASEQWTPQGRFQRCRLSRWLPKALAGCSGVRHERMTTHRATAAGLQADPVMPPGSASTSVSWLGARQEPAPGLTRGSAPPRCARP